MDSEELNERLISLVPSQCTLSHLSWFLCLQVYVRWFDKTASCLCSPQDISGCPKISAVLYSCSPAFFKWCLCLLQFSSLLVIKWHGQLRKCVCRFCTVLLSSTTLHLETVLQCAGMPLRYNSPSPLCAWRFKYICIVQNIVALTV